MTSSSDFATRMKEYEGREAGRRFIGDLIEEITKLPLDGGDTVKVSQHVC